MTRRARTVLVACAALVLAGCARRTPELRYYTLAVPGAPARALDAPVRVGPFSADPPYTTARLAYRTSPYRLDYYVYHRWAADPRQVVASAVRDYLEQPTRDPRGEPFEVQGHVRRLEEVDEADGRSGAVALDLRVERGGRLVLERSYAATEPAEGRGPEATTAALSRALGRILDRLTADLAGATGG